ncbi:unnamed protein product [Closterium sp. Naga37s-1]|nr:unnamed protein product [Closterium sp. Naga37s-1]
MAAGLCRLSSDMIMKQQRLPSHLMVLHPESCGRSCSCATLVFQQWKHATAKSMAMTALTSRRFGDSRKKVTEV